MPALRFASMYIAVSAVCLALLLLNVFPMHPHTWLGWALLFVVALPITACGEFIGWWLFHNPLARAIERRPLGAGSRLVRFVYILVVFVLSGSLAVVAFHWLPPL